MRRHIRLLAAILITVVVSGCGTAAKETEPTALPSVDNTAVNTRDNADTTATPPDQKENDTDLAITANIRKAVVDDKALSLNAHNVKIITSAGIVTLRGPVKSEQEKQSIEAKAKQVVGVTRIDNQLEIEARQ
jgi:hyperosmotically inducible protein